MKISLNSTSSWKRQGVAMLGIAAMLTLCGQSLVYAQLSASDIAAMKQEITKQKYTFTVDENPATKIPLSQLCGFIPSLAPKSANSLSSKTMMGGPALPSYWDWRQYNGVTPVKNQGNCGSCWAFSTVGTMEAVILIASGTTTDLSEQQLVSCNPYGWGCGGGNYAFDMEMSPGAMLESCFPYRAADMACQTNCPYVYQLGNWGYVSNSWSVPSTNAIKNAIYTYGPISVCVSVDSYFQAYSGGVYNDNSCSNLDHAVVLVGWDDTNGCWIMKNSWGTGWGESGYMRIAYGCDLIGYAAAYAVWVLADPLLITPATGFTSICGVGGPFTVTSESLTLTNAGTNSLTWALANTSDWLNASPGGGTLTPGGPAATVTVSLNSTASNLVVGTYSAMVWFTNLNDNIRQSRQFSLSVMSPPLITQQPTNQTVPTGGAALFSVVATSSLPLSCFWQRNSVFIAGGTNSTYTTNNVQLSDSGSQFSCLVSNFCGTTNSQVATLTVLTLPPSITQQPTNQTVHTGDAALFSVAATGSLPLSYFWQQNSVFIAGGTNSTYTTNNVQLSDSGSQFSCLVSNAYGSVLSSNALLTVLLVQNGGFELGTFDYWTTSGSFQWCLVTSDAPYVHSGVYGAELGPVGSLSYLSQTLATTVGQMYLVSCWLYCDGLTPNEFSVSWNGATLFDQQNIGATLWTNLQFLASATATNTVLTFGFQDDPSDFGLDDIAVYPITPPQFRTVTLTNGTISFNWSAQAGLLYQVQDTTNLASTNWINLGSPVTATGATLRATDSVTNGPQRFYRVMLSP